MYLLWVKTPAKAMIDVLVESAGQQQMMTAAKLPQADQQRNTDCTHGHDWLVVV